SGVRPAELEGDALQALRRRRFRDPHHGRARPRLRSPHRSPRGSPRGRPRDPFRHVDLGRGRPRPTGVRAMTDSKEVLIKLDGVTKVFLTDEVETHALSGIHLEIQQGEYVAIAGPSGCGKSTLLAILGLLDTATEGTYMLNGNQVANLSLSERARVRNREIGFIFQSFNLIGD